MPRIAILVALILAALVTRPAAAQDETAAGPLLSARAEVLHQALIGTWRSRIGDRSLLMRFERDGELQLGDERGRWRVDPGAKVVLALGAREDAVNAAIASGQLTLTGGQLAGPLVFARDPGMSDFMFGWLGIQPSSGAHRALRLLAILSWIVLARLLIALVGFLGRVVILSQWGPLRRVFPRRPLRASTLLSLALNTCKYVIYGIGLGFVLSTFDVDYTTYLASLSVIGLAIGFGSQGLVQDMVTGIFILVESQFDVGDIVELSGQVGVVQEMGLRMTRLTTIQGQVVTIPNRSIAMVARYGPRGLKVEVSVGVPAGVEAERVRDALSTVLGQVADQFSAAVLAVHQPRIADAHDDRQVVRVDLDLWPGQQAVLDQQVLPRLRTALPAENFGDCATTVAWHFDRPQIATKPLAGLSRWFGRVRGTGS